MPKANTRWMSEASSQKKTSVDYSMTRLKVCIASHLDNMKNASIVGTLKQIPWYLFATHCNYAQPLERTLYKFSVVDMVYNIPLSIFCYKMMQKAAIG